MSCLRKCAVGTSDVDGQTRDLLALFVCHRNDEEVWNGANQTHGHATRVVARELEQKLVWAQRDSTSMNTANMGA